MVRTMVYLPEELHKAIKHLAIERRTSIAKLIQEALEVLYREDLEDLQSGRERLQDYLKAAENFSTYDAYQKKRRKHSGNS